MKKIIFLMLLSFAFKGQTPVGDKGMVVKDSLIENMPTASQKIEAIRQKVASGQSSMSDMARLYSEDPGSAKNGGLILNVTRGKMVPAFEAVAFSLKAGELSDVFETQFGYHFIQLLECNKESVNLRHILIRQK